MEATQQTRTAVPTGSQSHAAGPAIKALALASVAAGVGPRRFGARRSRASRAAPPGPDWRTYRSYDRDREHAWVRRRNFRGPCYDTIERARGGVVVTVSSEDHSYDAIELIGVARSATDLEPLSPRTPETETPAFVVWFGSSVEREGLGDGGGDVVGSISPSLSRRTSRCGGRRPARRAEVASGSRTWPPNRRARLSGRSCRPDRDRPAGLASLIARRRRPRPPAPARSRPTASSWVRPSVAAAAGRQSTTRPSPSRTRIGGPDAIGRRGAISIAS